MHHVKDNSIKVLLQQFYIYYLLTSGQQDSKETFIICNIIIIIIFKLAKFVWDTKNMPKRINE